MTSGAPRALLVPALLAYWALALESGKTVVRKEASSLLDTSPDSAAVVVAIDAAAHALYKGASAAAAETPASAKPQEPGAAAEPAGVEVRHAPAAATPAPSEARGRQPRRASILMELMGLCGSWQSRCRLLLILVLLLILGRYCLQQAFLLGQERPRVFSSCSEAGEVTTCKSPDAPAFLAAFNQAPHRRVRFRFTGRKPEAAGLRHCLWNCWRAGPSGHCFDISLDLAPFVSEKSFLDEANLEVLQHFLASGGVLDTLSIEKSIEWEGWEELARRVRHRLYQLGFPGKVETALECDEQVLVYRDHPWPNLLRNWAVQLALGLSVLGGCLVFPYLWARGRHSSVRARFVVRIEPSRYWELIQVGLSAEHGFHVK